MQVTCVWPTVNGKDDARTFPKTKQSHKSKQLMEYNFYFFHKLEYLVGVSTVKVLTEGRVQI